MSESSPIRDRCEPSAKVLALLGCAAEKRARGYSWNVVARELCRSIETWQLWLREHPATWDRLLRLAEGRIFREAGAEALAILRGLLRSESETIRRDVGRTITCLMFREPRDNTGETPTSDPIFDDIGFVVREVIDEEIAQEEQAAAQLPESNDATTVDASTPPVEVGDSGQAGQA